MLGKGSLLFIGFILFSPLYALSLVEGLKEAVQISPEIKEKVQRYIEISKDKNIVISSWSPSLSFVGAYEYKKYSSGSFEEQTTTSSAVQLTLNLFNGLSDWNQYDIEKARYISAQTKVLEERNRLSLEFIQNYLEVLKNRDLLKISQLSLDNHLLMYNKIKKKVEVGLGRQLELRHSKSSLDLAKFTYKIQKRNLSQEQIRFSKLLKTMIDVEHLEEPKPQICLSSTFEEANKIAFTTHPSIRIAHYNIDVVEQEFEESKKGYLPSLDLSANYYFDHSISTLNQTDDYDVGVRFTYNIFNGLSDSNKRQKQQTRLFQKQELLRKNRRDVTNRLQLAWSSYQLNKEKYAYSQINAASRRDSLRSYDYEFMLGKASLNAMLDANEAYFASLKEMSKSYYELLLDYYKVLEAIGILFEEVTNTQESKFACHEKEHYAYNIALDQKIGSSIQGSLDPSYKCYKVLSNKLNIRQKSTIKSKKNGFLIKDTIFCSQRKTKDWIRTAKGWVNDTYVQNISILQ